MEKTFFGILKKLPPDAFRFGSVAKTHLKNFSDQSETSKKKLFWHKADLTCRKKLLTTSARGGKETRIVCNHRIIIGSRVILAQNGCASWDKLRQREEGKRKYRNWGKLAFMVGILVIKTEQRRTNSSSTEIKKPSKDNDEGRICLSKQLKGVAMKAQKKGVETKLI